MEGTTSTTSQSDDDDIDLTPPKHMDCYHRQMFEFIDPEERLLTHKQSRWPIPFQQDAL
jgi:hypothetical protein